jgi:hypothetical protein
MIVFEKKVRISMIVRKAMATFLSQSLLAADLCI